MTDSSRMLQILRRDTVRAKGETRNKLNNIQYWVKAIDNFAIEGNILHWGELKEQELVHLTI